MLIRIRESKSNSFVEILPFDFFRGNFCFVLFVCFFRNLRQNRNKPVSIFHQTFFFSFKAFRFKTLPLLILLFSGIYSFFFSSFPFCFCFLFFQSISVDKRQHKKKGERERKEIKIKDTKVQFQ
jgi:hypothetical protein